MSYHIYAVIKSDGSRAQTSHFVGIGRVQQSKNVYQGSFVCLSFRVVLSGAYRRLTGGFLLLRNFSVAISVGPHVCFVLVLILISMFLR